VESSSIGITLHLGIPSGFWLSRWLINAHANTQNEKKLPLLMRVHKLFNSKVEDFNSTLAICVCNGNYIIVNLASQIKTLSRELERNF
jgi:hypothetical protein